MTTPQPISNTTKIGKEYRWEMGHRLPFHTGLCKNIHGHSYRLLIELEGTLNSEGMVMDFYDLNTIVEPIISTLDHSFICDEEDSTMKSFFSANPMKVVYVPFHTTAENIVRWIANQVVQACSIYPSITSVRARLHETERAYADVVIPIG